MQFAQMEMQFFLLHKSIKNVDRSNKNAPYILWNLAENPQNLYKS